MLRIHSSNQASFFDYCLDDALSKNEMLFNVDAILKETPNLLDPFIDHYLKDRKEKEIDINFGKPTIALESFVRLLLLKHLYKNCDYREVESRAKTDYAWKAFAKMSVIDAVPDYTTLIKWEEFFGEKTIRSLHSNIIDHFRKRKVIKGKKMRTDTTVAEANIHYPTDPSILSDAIRTITKTVEKIKKVIKIKTIFRSQVKAIKKKIFDLSNSLKKRTGKAKESARKATKEINETAKKIIQRAKEIEKEIKGRSIDKLRKTLQDQIDLANRISNQTDLVLKGINPKERIVSFFHPYSRPIVKGKLSKDCEFGKKLEINEVEHGIITEWKNHIGNPSDVDLLIPSIDKHKEIFGHDPTEVDTDRGFYSEENEEKLRVRIKRIGIPKRGHKSKRRLKFEKSKRFIKGQRWRSGGEAKISWLKRSFTAGRSKAKTEEGFDRSIGLGIIACNLKVLSRLS
jgi:transposase, IS5 family